MSQSIQLQVTQVGLEQSIAAAMKRAGNSSQINLGTNSRQINALSQPLGRITGQADEFSKSMAAANARVLAFGASAGIIAGVSSAMAGLLQSTIKVEKSLVEIGSVLNKSSAELDKFGQGIFNVAKNTGKSFDEVATGALELARQGLSAEDTLSRLNDALILSRLSGLDAKQSVEGLTAAFNSFKQSGITTSEILNKVVAVSQKFAVSERDIIEGLGRSASVADLAGVSFEELSAIITAVQEKTARGGAVIGNSFKTIFARIQDKAVLSDLQDIGIGVTDLQGNVLPALKILENLAAQMDSFSQIEQADISKKLGGIYQLDKLLAALKDLSSESSVYRKALAEQEKAGISAYQKNAVLNTTLASLINKVTVSAEQLGAKLGEIGVTDSLKNVLGFFNSLLEGIQKILGEESGLGNVVRGLVKGLGSFLAGPGLALFGAIILKLSKDLIQFGFASLKAFFGIGKAAKEVQNVESAISQILSKNVNLQQQLFALEGNRAAQLRVITTALVEQEALLRRSAAISSGLAAPLYGAGVRAKDSGLRVGNSAGGYMPAVAKESKAIKQGVGGARSGDKPVVMPNFNFGGGKKGTMVAHSGEYVVPNFNGSGGSAVFNRQMVRSMGLPSGARKIGAAGGFVPNFAEEAKQRAAKTLGTAEVLESIGFQGNESYPEIFKKIEETYNGYTANWSVDKRSGKISNSSFQILDAGGRSLTKSALTTAEVNKKIASKKIEKSKEIYDANVGFNKAVMLIPQAQKYNASEANMAFDVPRKIGSKEYAAFRGGIAGVDKNLSDVEGKNLSRISDIDNSLRKALSGAAFSIIKKIQPGIKLDDTSDLSSKNIENLLEKGGAGAFGSIKGALFEAIISKVAKAKGKNFEEQGSLDVDFDAGGADSRKTLETIFGLTANTFDFADFKNSKKSKDKYVQQVMNYLPKDKDISKTSSAAGGYIPNFVSKSREMGSGAAGTFFRLGKNKEGTNVGVKKFKNYIPSRSIEAEWLTSEFVNKYANIPGVFGPKNLSSFEDSKRKRAIRKEVVSDPLARTAVGSQKASDFGQKVLFQAFKARGLQIGDFHGSNYTLNKSAQDAINGMQSFPSDPVGAFSALRQIAATGGRIGAIDVGAANVTDPARSIIGKIMERQVSQKTAAGGYIPNFANPLTDAFGGLRFAASAANTFRKTLPKGSVKKAIKEKNFDPIFNSLLRFFSNPSRLIKSSGDLDSAKKAIKLALNNDIIREAFAKRVAPLISSQNYDTNAVFQKDRRSPDDFERKVENYTKYKLFGGTKDLNQYAPEGIKGLTQKGKYLKINDPKVQAELSASAMGRSGFRNEYRRLDDKGNYFASNYLLGGYTGRARMFKGKAYGSYKDRWDVNLNPNEKEFLKERLNKGPFDNYFEDFDDEDASKSEKLDSELGANTYGAADIDSFILRELVSAIPKAKPAIFKGVVPISIGGLASGYIPNFAQGAPNRGGKFTAVQIAKGLGKAAIKVLIDQYLGDGVLDSVESAGLTKMKPSDFKFFTEELKKPIKGKHRRAFERALKDPATRAQFERMRSGGASAAGGFLPNFANPLQDAVGREMAAGVPASQIYIDKNSSLKNAMNPMGLMVANRRDEPAGGFQGINRARREGANPMMYGAASGFVPNYAAGATGPDLSPYAGKSVADATAQIQQELTDSLKKIDDEYDNQQKSLKKTSENLKKRSKIEADILIAEKNLLKQIQDNLAAAQKAGGKSPAAQAAITNMQIQEAQQQKAVAAARQPLRQTLDERRQIATQSQTLATDRVNRIAERNQNATNLQTAVSQNARRSVSNPLGRVRDPNPAAGGSRDMLGTIFAVQGAMSALTGATDGASSNLAKFGNLAASAAGAATTVLFAGQGLSQALGGADKGMGKFVGKLGVYGAVVIGLYTAFKEGVKWYDQNNISIRKATEASGRLAEAASKASVNLENINPARRKRFEKEAESSVIRVASLAQMQTSGGKTTAFQKLITPLAKTAELASGVKVPTTALRATDLTEGLSDELISELNSSVAQARGVGIPREIIDQRLLDYALKGERNFAGEVQLSADQAEKYIDDLTEMVSQISSSVSPQNLLAKIGEDNAKVLGNASYESLQKAQSTAETMVFNEDKTSKEAKALFSEALKNETPESKILSTLIRALNQAGISKESQKDYISKTSSLAQDQERRRQEETINAVTRSPRELAETIKAIKREKTERESIRLIDQSAATERYNSALAVAGIEADLTLSASERAIKIIETQAALEKQTAELEAQKTIQEDINKLTAEFIDKDLFKGSGAEDTVRKTLNDLKNNEEAKNLLTSPNQQADAFVFAQNALKNTKLEQNVTAAEQLAKAILEALNLQEKTNQAVTDGNKEREKGKNLDIAKNKIQEQNNRLLQDAQSRLSAIADNYSVTAAGLGRGSQVLQAEQRVSVARYRANTLETDPDKLRRGEQSINDFFFKKILENNAKQSIEQAKSDFLRNLKIDDNIAKLIDNSKATQDNTVAINEFKDEFVRMKNVGEGPLSESPKYSYVDLKDIKENGANVAMLNKNLAENIQKFAQAYKLKTGRELEIMGPRSGYRTEQEQHDIRNEAIRKGGMEYAMKYTATPGKSFHGKGLALDINQNQIAEAENLGIKLSDYGLTRPMSHEAWHVELSGARNQASSMNRIASTGVTSDQALSSTLTTGMESFKIAEDIASQYEKPSDMLAAAEKAVEKFNLMPDAARKAADGIQQLAMKIDEVGVNKAFEQQLENLRKIEEQANNTRRSLAYSEKSALEERLKTPSSTFSEGMENAFLQMQADGQEFAYLLGKDIPKMFSDGMSNAINSAIEGTATLKDSLRNAAYEFVKGINQRIMSNLINSVVGDFGNFGMGVFQKKAAGGMINGGSGMKDDVPAMLMGGEYVVNKKAVSKYGAQFLESINNGTLTGYAKGGKVQKGPQGNFYTPGTFGQGAIEGKQNLLDFATQTGTSGKFDQIINELGYQSVALEAESSRLSVSGMRNTPMFEATQSAKEQAFDLYLQQYNQEIEARKQKEAQKKAMRNQLIMLVASVGLNAAATAGKEGFQAAFEGAEGQGFLKQLGAGAKGAFTGAKVGNQTVGGINQLFSSAGKAFSGDFSGAANQFKLSQIGNAKQLSDLYQSDKNFASYINKSGGIGALRAERFSGIGDARSGMGVVQYGNISRRAIGGMIPSTSGIDTVPAMLSGGEFVMNRSAVQGIGAPNLQSMNSGGTSITSEETSKELNEKLLAKLDELIGASGSTGNITINVTQSGQTTEENSQDPSEKRQQLARQIKGAVLQIINDEKRIGGSLRR